MSTGKPVTDLHLHRLEVHSGPHKLDDGESLEWQIRVGRFKNDLVFVAYLGREEVDGTGQAQAFGFRLGRDDASVLEWTREDAVEWGIGYGFEPLWDLCRRALQSQASAMDFQFDLDLKAPEPELSFDEAEFPVAEGRPASQSAASPS